VGIEAVQQGVLSLRQLLPAVSEVVVVGGDAEGESLDERSGGAPGLYRHRRCFRSVPKKREDVWMYLMTATGRCGMMMMLGGRMELLLGRGSLSSLMIERRDDVGRVRWCDGLDPTIVLKGEP
jgi:hypothetical protein